MISFFRKKAPAGGYPDDALAAPRRLGETAHPSDIKARLFPLMVASNAGLVALVAAFGLGFIERDRAVRNHTVFVEVQTDAKRTVRILESADRSIELRNALADDQARHFFELTNEILRDDISMNQRWERNGPVASRTTDGLYARLKADLDQAKGKYGSLSYEQRVRSIKQFRTGPRSITATIETAILDSRGLEVKRDTWTAVLEYAFHEFQSETQHQANQTGWYVFSYTLSLPRS